MKKLLKIMMVVMMVIGVTACSSQEEKTDEQEAIVNSFFKYVANNDYEKLNEICSDHMTDSLGFVDLNDEFDEIIEADEYGETFVQEAREFKDKVFKNLFKSYKIGEIEVDDDRTMIQVTGKYSDYNSIDIDNFFNQQEVEQLVEDYANQHMSELLEIEETQGEKAAVMAIMDHIFPILFDQLNQEVEKVKEEKLNVTFILEKEDDQWKITNIKRN